MNVITKYFQKKSITQSIADAQNIRTLFVIQPVPMYKYDLHYHPFVTDPATFGGYPKYGYPLMQSVLNGKPPDKDLLWLADMQENEHKQLYVDISHYSGEMNQMIANKISDYLQKQSFLLLHR